ncbi:hypothetical protein L0V05_07375 [Tabrizicola sp. J26]|uniref:hypothetical protein n=1 Tax=Alitabrizicola rongguiensis TaxID=2909234 RepID=UPI001F29C881|nr:hypothetical protein [Tabrizicola rongguiensis]MCF1708636.1 hypothetical protein [Tabrizicola rongguiensis]
MRAIRHQDQDGAGLVGLGARVLLLAPAENEALFRRIAGLGGRVDHEVELYSALDAVISDPADWDLFVMDCDAFGGIEAGRRAFAMLGMVAERMPMILTSASCQTQEFPADRRAPILLRAPATVTSLRVGMEHALHSRLNFRF